MVAFIDRFLCEMECGKCIKHCIMQLFVSYPREEGEMEETQRLYKENDLACNYY